MQIFFNESYLKEHPDHEEGVKKLRLLIEEQVREGVRERERERERERGRERGREREGGREVGREKGRVSEERSVSTYICHIT